MTTKVLIFFFFLLSGFARVSYTKIYGIQLFVIIAIVYIVYKRIFNNTRVIKLGNYEVGALEYKKFILWSIPALGIGLYYNQTDALYFYAYTVIPYILYQYTKNVNYNFNKCLLFAEISVLIVISLGWAIFWGLLPINFLFNEVTEAEYELGYWGISYLESSRNHDYMYPLLCAAISIYLFKNSTSIIKKGAQLIIFGICEITLLASLARGGMIASIIYFIMMVKGLSKKERTVFFSCLFVLTILFGGIVKDRMGSIFENIFLSIFGLTKTNQYGGGFSNDIRKKIYEDAIIAGLLNPIGYGIQNFGITSKYGGGSAENAYLTVLVERGWFACVFFVSFLWKKWQQAVHSELRQKSLNYYLLPAIATYFLFNYEFTSYMCVFIFYLILVSNIKTQNV